MKKTVIILFLLPVLGFAQIKKPIRKLPIIVKPIMYTTNFLDISGGLKEALNKGITDQVSKLAIVNGFLGNETVKILMPEDLFIVENTMRSLGMGNLIDDGIKSLNRAAEDAVKEAIPIFVLAIKSMKINDARNILLGGESAATNYLQTATRSALYQKLNPVIQQSLGRVGADVLWNSIIKKYNNIPIMGNVNPDITDYVTSKTLEGVFKMIAIEEKNIRSSFASRSTSLLQSVFALQDQK